MKKENIMKIELINSFYTISEIAETANTSWGVIYHKIESLEITADIKINNVKAYSFEKMRKILGLYSYEKSIEDVINDYKHAKLSVDEYDVLESSINNEG